ncbi:hypothetical protein BDV10DRAFT_198272 [Aspergillus recurvatus]
MDDKGADTPMIKQLVAVRRKAGMTREEFLNYHYQVHGSLSTGPSPSETPLKYFQTHFVDTAYHADTSQKVPNAHPAWAFSDDITELYFHSMDHMSQVFTSEWVTQKVGPDGANFSDFSAVLPMLVQEETVQLSDSCASTPPTGKYEEHAFVAMYFVAPRDPIEAGVLTSKLTSAIQSHAAADVLKLVANTPIEIGFDIGAYFGVGRPIPRYHVFTITLRGKTSICSLRKVQAIFEEECADLLNLPETWIGFGERAVVLDQTEDIKFDPRRQPYQTL